MWLYHLLSIHSSIDVHLGYFQLLAVMNNAAVNIHVQVLLKHLFSILLGVYLRVELLGHKVILSLTIEEVNSLLNCPRSHSL